jgi:hypothetical protein
VALSDFVNVSITTVDAGVTQAGFGTVMILAHHNAWTNELVREYSSLSGLTADGFSASGGDGVYRAAQKLLSQNPRVTKFKVGRLTTGNTQKVTVTPTVANNATYGFKVVTPAGVEHSISYTSDGDATAAEIIAGLETQVEAISGAILAGTDDTTFLTIDAAAANTHYGFKDFSSNLAFADISPAPAALSDQLDAIVLEDGDFYGLLCTSRGNPVIAALAAWTEANERFYFYSTGQSAAKSGTTANIGKTLKDGSYVRSVGRWSNNWYDFPEAGFAGKLLPYDPGSENWAFKTIGGDTVDSLTETEVSNLQANNLNWYQTVAGRNITGKGVTAEGTYVDIVRLRDWAKARMQERVFGLLASQVKVPYTDVGVTMVEAEIRGVIQDGINNGAIATDPAPVVTAPLVASVSAQNKSDRHLPDVRFSFTLTGAINSVAVSGTVSI